MTADSAVDPESFDRLLSNAFSVQESGIDGKSLTAIVEIHRAITTGQADVDRAMEVIAGHARRVANASGITIGLLKGDRLVYRAGSGRGMSYVGQHVIATLSVSAGNAARGEILRVENVQTDRRIEAAICRQFGARSLLILPIYHKVAMAGVLNVLFDEAHVFEHSEVLTYRLMTNLVGEAMSYAAQPDQKKTAESPSRMRQSVELTRPQGEASRTHAVSVPAASRKHATYPAPESVTAWATTFRGFLRPAWPALNRAKGFPRSKCRWQVAMVAAVILLACWIGFRDRRPALPSGDSDLQQLRSVAPPVAVAPANRVLVIKTSKPQPAIRLEPAKGQTESRPTRVSDVNIRVRYISDDVTVRYFTPKPPPKAVLHKQIRVRYISDDVTVRYFTPEPQVNR